EELLHEAHEAVAQALAVLLPDHEVALRVPVLAGHRPEPALAVAGERHRLERPTVGQPNPEGARLLGAGCGRQREERSEEKESGSSHGDLRVTRAFARAWAACPAPRRRGALRRR